MRYTVQRIRSSTFRGIRPFCLGKISSKLSTVELMDPERSTVSRAFFMANWREAAAASREDMISQTSFVVKLSSAMGIDEYWWSPLLDGKRVEQIRLHCASWSRRIVNDIMIYIYIMMSFTLYTLSSPLCTIKWNGTVRLWMVSKSQYLLWIHMCKMFSWSVGPSWFLSLSLSLQFVCIGGIFEKLCCRIFEWIGFNDLRNFQRCHLYLQEHQESSSKTPLQASQSSRQTQQPLTPGSVISTA